MAHLGPKPGVACWGSGRCDIGDGISVKEFPSDFCVAGSESDRFRASLRLVEVWDGRYMASGFLRSGTQGLSIGDSRVQSSQTLLTRTTGQRNGGDEQTMRVEIHVRIYRTAN